MSNSKDELLRQRGWSIQSEGDQVTHEDKDGQFSDHPPSDGEDAADTSLAQTQQDLQTINKKRSRHDEEESAAEETDAKKPRILQLAKQRLSKWAARLFDPDRPKGLIEFPEIIPLNDTFLSAFGKREKEFDNQLGISLDIETLDEDDDHEDEEDGSAHGVSAAPAVNAIPSAALQDSLFKVKVANLKFTTTEQTLLNACRKFGQVHSLVMAMDDEKKTLNKGRAVVTFVQEAAGMECIDKLMDLDGRKLRLTAANAAASTANGGGVSAAQASRYYSRDISTRCFHCGKVGHYSDACPNERLAKPCPNCSKTDHDLRMCPSRNVCFNCGLPGHVVRDCNLPRGQPQRRICTICFFSGHTKEQCRSYDDRMDVASQAFCMICGVQGHFMCRDNQWYFGLRGISCSNCGRTGHLGSQCDRPRLDDCLRNEDVATAEVERAATWSFAEDEINRRQQQESRGRSQERQQNQHQRFDSDARRHQSMPARPRDRRPDNNGEYRGHGQAARGLRNGRR